MVGNRRWWALIALSLATFMTFLDNNVVNVALPSIQRDLHLTLSGLEWVVSSYILVFAGLLLVGGRLADVLGQRRIFVLGLVVFTGASLLAGVSGTPTLLLVSRALQGVGAALVTPTALALIPALFPDTRERNVAVGVWGAVGALALAIGPLTGGLLSQYVHWGWIFLVNVPIGVATLALARVSIPVGDARPVGVRLDLPGLATSALGLFALTFALIEGERRGWGSALIVGSFVVAALAAVAFVVIELRSAEPMMDLSIFRERVFTGGVLAMGLWAFGVFGIYFFTTLFLQNVLGFTPTQAGAAFVPTAVVMAVMATLAPRISQRFGIATTVAAGLALMGVAIAGLTTVDAGGSYPDLLPWLLVYAVGGGALVPLTSAILGMLPADRAGVASSVQNVVREVFGLLGVTVIGAILTGQQSSDLRAGTTPAAAFLDAYQGSLLVAAAVVLVGVPVSLYALRSPSRPAVVAAEPEPVLV